MKIFGREPTLVLQALSAVLAVFVTFGWDGLTDVQAGAIVAFATALIGVANAIAVRPWQPALFTGLITAGAVLLGTYGINLDQKLIGAVQVAVTAVMALLTRVQVSPASEQ
jgi:hypothetical protein